ncbi:hypothetical protein [Halobacillus locisalis]
MSWKKYLLIAATILFSSMTIPTTISAQSSYSPQIVEYKYSYKVMHGIIQTLKKEEGMHVFEAIEEIESMPQVRAMDLYLDKLGKKVDGDDIRWTVREIYSINLDAVSELDAGKQVTSYPETIMEGVEESLSDEQIEGTIEEYIFSLSKVEVMDLYLESLEGTPTGAEARVLINDIFGVNLDGISSLEKAGISLFSKEQWIMQSEKDLFAVYTGVTDVDVYILPTEYFTEQTGLTTLPEALQERLKAIGYSYNEDVGGYYYAEPNGESVPDAFKGQTLGTLAGFIQEEYAELLQ